MDEHLVRFHWCCRRILAAPTGGSTLFLDYAKQRAEKGLACTNLQELEDRILYILTNLQYWRGKEAQEVKNELRTLLAERRMHE